MDDQERFSRLMAYAHAFANGKYTLYDKEGKRTEAVYYTDYESDNGLAKDEEGYEEYSCIAFKRISDGTLLEINYHRIPAKVVCDREVIY